ncbi:MAG TPA: ABC transporter permease, partial [Gemmataceae bacterium]|nr:ABC transporter permease [Gemmataceae bacterium]
MAYALTTIWHERNRFLPGVLAVAFSALLIALQSGLLLGLFSIVSIPIDRGGADVWVGCPGVQSVDLGMPVPEAWKARLAAQPEVAATETYLQGFVLWGKPDDGVEMCSVIGTRLEDGSFGAIRDLTPELRAKLTEPGAIVVDEGERERLGITGAGHTAEVMGVRVRVVGFVRGLKGLAGAYMFCSLPTARMLLSRAGVGSEQTTYLLARCHDPADAAAVARRLRSEKMAAFTREEFSLQSRLHWLIKTKAGLAMGGAALLGLIVGAAVTSQTLYAATAAALREYAVLEALGIPTWRMASLVLSQSLWVGVAGLVAAAPAILGFAYLFEAAGIKVLLPPWLLAATGAVTLAMALLSGLVALRSLKLAEPANLL